MKVKSNKFYNRSGLTREYEANELAARKGGMMLSTGHIVAFTKCAWQCARGHKWIDTLNNATIVWCKRCVVIPSTDPDVCHIVRSCMNALFDTTLAPHTPNWVNVHHGADYSLDGYCATKKVAFVMEKKPPPPYNTVDTETDLSECMDEREASMQLTIKALICASHKVFMIRIPHYIVGVAAVKTHLVKMLKSYYGDVAPPDALHISEFMDPHSTMSTRINMAVIAGHNFPASEWPIIVAAATKSGIVIVPHQVYTPCMNLLFTCSAGHTGGQLYKNIVAPHSQGIACAQCDPDAAAVASSTDMSPVEYDVVPKVARTSMWGIFWQQIAKFATKYGYDPIVMCDSCNIANGASHIHICVGSKSLIAHAA